MSDRYAGRPLLRLIECYVLDAIDELDAADAERLRWTAPKITEALGSVYTTWQGAVKDALDLPDTFPDSLRSDWKANRSAAQAAGSEITAEEFAAAVADTFAV